MVRRLPWEGIAEIDEPEVVRTCHR
jgi:hypothetical protein